MKEEIEYIRKCPDCNIELKTKNIYHFKKCKKENKKCLSCSLKGRKFTEEHKKNLSKNHADVNGENNPFFKKNHTDETKKKIREKNLGIDRFSEDQKEKIRIKYRGEGNPFYGKKHSEETKNYLRSLEKTEEHRKKLSEAGKGKVHSQESKNKISKVHKGKKKSLQHRINLSITNKKNPNVKHLMGPKSDETKRKMRLSTIRRLQEKFPDKNIFSNIGDGEYEYFKKLEEINKWNGNFYFKNKKSNDDVIKNLGYFVDYYEPNLNIVVEYDETYHYNKNWELREKDVKRQNEIIKYLNCKFYRYNAPLDKFYEVFYEE